MKLFAVIGALLLFGGVPSYAQWLDNSNKFNDSLHMPVCTALDNQQRTIVVKSEDGGYFLVWEDSRNGSAGRTDIYGQKFDKDGRRLWALDGVPVASSPNEETLKNANNFDWRKYSMAAPDGSGGLYVCWSYYEVTGNSNNSGVAVQHLHADGSRAFGDGGAIIASAVSSQQYVYPQLVSDSKGGFFIGYEALQQLNGIGVLAYCYKDEGGTLKLYGGGVMNQTGKEDTVAAECGPHYTVRFDAYASVQSFMLYPDQQGGCNVVMAISTGQNQMDMGYNRLVRVKKDCHTTVLKRALGDIARTTTYEKDYKKDSVVKLYNLTTYNWVVSCHPINNPNILIEYTNTKIENDGYGYLKLNPDPRFFVDRPQGVILQTGGNINAELISTSERWQDSKGVISNYHLHGYYRLNEIYDSIPYELCTDLDHPYQAYRPILPDNAIPTDTLLAGPDTLIGHTLDRQPENYWLEGSGNKAWATVMGPDAGTYSVYLQELKLVSAGTKKYTFVINTADKLGVKIGQEIPTGGYTTMVTYNTPAIATDDNGHALFYVMEASRSARVSPIGEGGILSWGAMGKAISSGYWARRELGSQYPMAVLGNEGKGLIAWDALRYDDVNTSRNIFMERISDVFIPSYQPPLNTLSLLTTSGSSSIPAYLTGGTNVWTTIDGLVFNFNSGGNNVTTPIVSLKDNYPLGFVKVSTYEWASAVRLTNGIPYLNRNFTITVDNNPNGSGNIPMRFYIPQAMFDALKAADPGISSPGDLGVIDQPSTGSTAPSAYTPTGTEQILSLTGWGAIDGGYYIEFIAKGFSNFFITKGVVPLPLKWIDVTGKLASPVAAAISWTVTEEKNVKGYTVQYSSDRVNFIDGCVTGSTNSGATTTYGCTVALPAAGTYSFRVKQEDLDGKYSYSKVIVLNAVDAAEAFTVSPNPASGTAVLRIPGGAVVKKLTLMSMSGKTVWQSQGALNGAVTIPLGQLPAGVYHLQVMQDKEVKVLKILKK